MEYITPIFGGLISLIVGIALYRIKEQDAKIDEFTKSITALQNTAVSDSHVRNVVKEELRPLTSSTEQLLKSMHNIELHIAQERGFKAGLMRHKVSVDENNT
jgi:hypothetical protein